MLVDEKGLKLAEPIKIGSLEVKNRIVKAGMVENMATEQGEVTEELIKFYEKQALGGAGLLITGGAYIQKNGRSVKYLIGAYDDSLIPGLERLAKAVHRLEGKIILQVYHCGRQTMAELVKGNVVSASAVRDSLTKVLPRAMTEEEIAETIDAFGQAGRRAKEAGFDGVEILAGHGYLINQFLAKRTNRRNDHWGGSLENRARFLFRILEEIRKRVGADFPILVKMNTADQMKNGFSLEESRWVAERLSELGVNAIKFSGGTFESALNISRGDIPEKEILEGFSGWEKVRTRLIIKAMKRKFRFSEAYFLDNLKKIKPFVRVPAILVGGLRTPKLMEEIIRNGFAEMVALGRPLIREPELPKRILSGDLNKAGCLNCNRCFIRIAQEKSLRCYALKN